MLENPGAPRALETIPRSVMTFSGFLGERLEANVRGWLMTAPEANPAMLQMFRDRNRLPPRDLVPWAGEFAGKYLISAVQATRMRRDSSLRSAVRGFVRDLIATQDPDGYLGPFPKSEGMIGKGRWDLWGQYHVMLGLLAWWKETGDAAAMSACRRCADLFCRTFLGTGRRVLHAGSEEMNQSCIHLFALLYRETREPRYLRMAREIERDWETPPSGDYVRTALAGIPFYRTPKPRWESLHGIQAIAELYWITGEERYRRAFEQIWWSILEGDRHNTGGFSSGEQATGNPYDPRPIETCCTIAWSALTLDMLRLTGDSRAADELEISLWNGVLGAQHPSGRWWTYNTPMDGERKASAHDIVFQARAGSPELNCCSVNAPRGLGIVSEWALMSFDGGLALNYYGPCEIQARTPSGRRIRIRQRTEYPKEGVIRIQIEPESPEQFAMRLRIPGWSARTRVRLNGRPVESIRSGAYLALEREWRRDDVVELELDMSPWFWVGEREAAGRVSVYRGPILLAFETRLGAHDTQHLPVLNPAGGLSLVDRQIEGPQPFLLAEARTVGGGSLLLCDFASAGAAGSAYASWLPAQGLSPARFTRENPLRLVRPG